MAAGKIPGGLIAESTHDRQSASAMKQELSTRRNNPSAISPRRVSLNLTFLRQLRQNHGNSMRLFELSLMIFMLSGCASLPNYNKIAGGESISQAGLSFTTPENFEWNVITRETYRTNLASFGSDKNESYIIATTTFNIPPNLTGQEFLDLIVTGRAEEPETGRFETIQENIDLYSAREEVCTRHTSSSKDFGVKRSGEYALYEEHGMYCIHPDNNAVGVFVELSRKAPLSQNKSPIDEMGEKLLKSVIFSDFKV